MGKKGDRAKFEQIARQRYIETGNLTLVAEELDISRQTLTQWKNSTRRSTDEFDEWDRAREEKRSRIERLRAMFDQQLTAIEDLNPLKRDSKVMDSLSKLGALIEKWEGIEERARKQALLEVESNVDKAEKAAVQRGMSKEDAQFWREQVLGVTK